MGNIKSIKFVGNEQTNDLEVDHPDHQYYLSNGALTSNSHSIMYSMISYKTAYYKAHFPIEFLLANLMFEVKSNSPTAKAGIEKIKNEIRARKVKILPPNINESQLTYTMLDDKTLLTGLDALKFVGDEAIVDMISKRPFTSFQDFMSRVSSKLVRANTIQALAASGALDCFCVNGIRRKDIFLYVSDYRKKLTAWNKKHDFNTETFNYGFKLNDQDWTIEQKYALEVHYLNEGFVCKPHLAYGEFFNGNQILACHIKKAANKTILDPVKGIVVDAFEFKIKKEGSKFYGQSMAKIMIEDKTGERYACTIFPNGWEDIKQKIKEREKDLGIKEFGIGLGISFEGATNLYDDNIGVIFNKLFALRAPPMKPKDLKALKSSSRSKEEKIQNVKDIVETDILDKDLSSKIEDFLYEEGVLEADN